MTLRKPLNKIDTGFSVNGTNVFMERFAVGKRYRYKATWNGYEGEGWTQDAAIRRLRLEPKITC